MRVYGHRQMATSPWLEQKVKRMVLVGTKETASARPMQVWTMLVTQKMATGFEGKEEASQGREVLVASTHGEVSSM